MQTLSRASVHLLFLCSLPVLAATKIHTVVLGSVKKVPYLAADVAREDKTDEAGTLKVRPLLVDTKLKEWTTGEIHEVTERTFVVRRVLHVNDTLPGEKSAHWVWQPGPWLLVDRTSGRVSALHLPDFDASVSEVSWYRDYGAYCGVKTTVRGGGLVADVWQIGGRKAALQKVIGKWPQDERVRPVCATPLWQREPMRVTLKPTDGPAMSFDVVGTSAALIEDGDAEEN
ncbi:hypothetical protein [Terriglobus saanensis]|uniref:DUF3047 domain-containing protein n=1 Tax=Terriglobus saanensis (strain ATCC BAA-1853 / DSM 23119 / SP1PR4) TaxID=401053 RepID=E8UXF1_TERSS|nr:hypothetical protein [Terriglobus saanensis]ADV84175.1 hypothetical protein AciPR4_3421 [Terriglobus saanensis SP1PR4]